MNKDIILNLIQNMQTNLSMLQTLVQQENIPTQPQTTMQDLNQTQEQLLEQKLEEQRLMAQRVQQEMQPHYQQMQNQAVQYASEQEVNEQLLQNSQMFSQIQGR